MALPAESLISPVRLQGLVRYTVQAGDRAKQPAAIMGSAGSCGAKRKSIAVAGSAFSFIEDCAV